MFFRKQKEMQSLIAASRKALADAEKVVKEARENILQRDKFITQLSEQSEVLYKEKKQLEVEKEELAEFKNKVISIMFAEGTIVNKYDKINELVVNPGENKY